MAYRSQLVCSQCGYQASTYQEAQQHSLAYGGHVLTYRPTRKAGESGMAKLYGSMAGARTAGLVGHDELTAQVQTWKGCVRIWMDEDGNFEVYVADQEGENGLKLIEGNANTRTATDSQGNPFQAAPLQDKLDPIVVKNRGKAYAQKGGAKGGQTPAAPARSAAAAQAAPAPRKAAPQPKPTRTQAPATPMPSQKKRAPGKPSGRATAQPAGSAPQGPGFHVSDFAVGDRVMLAKVGSSAMRAIVGEEGKVEKIRVKSPIGPQVLIEWDTAGAGTVYPDQGDVITKV